MRMEMKILRKRKKKREKDPKRDETRAAKLGLRDYFAALEGGKNSKAASLEVIYADG